MEVGNILIEKYFRNKYSIIVIVLIAIIIGITLYFNIPIFAAKIVSIICVLVITLYYIVDTVIYNKLPKNKDGDAILVRIISKDKNEYEDIKYKFGSEFEKFTKNNKHIIKILYIPHHLIESNNYNEKEKIIKLLHKTNCIFLTTVKTRSEEIDKNKKFITEFNLGIIHPTYIDRIERVFQHEFNILGMPTLRLEYNNENKLETLEVTAQKISFVCRYIIARAYYLSNEFDLSINIAEQLFEELNTISNEEFKNVKNSVRLLCYDVHIAKMLIENSKVNNNIEYIEKEIEEANKYIKNTYIYFEVKSVCCFLKNRDIKKTQYYLGCCKEKEKNAPWKYSKAFLEAYCNQSEGKIIYHYKHAFKVPYDYMQLISFIEDIVLQEPDKNKLRFALVLLYLKIDEIKTAKTILDEYLKYEDLENLEISTINQLKKIYKDNIIKELIKRN